ncbi:BID domain-containing T4SS effector [Bartonella phoceensis]|uniref:BID domain-containing T4SS effector n=1 Tax=Bartonella phoceensis TaxID=270249 RepID=UPI001ABA1BD0|nr:BID domain-containing T4SS effector [Bartonella phoceensis]
MPKAKVKTKGTPSPYNYLYPGSKTLKNKYGIKSFDILQGKYLHDTQAAMDRLRKEQLPSYFDSFYLCHLHRKLFSHMFEWAGQLRNVPFVFEDGSAAAMPEMISSEWGDIFANSDEIQEGLQELDQMLFEKNNLQDLSREEFAYESAKLFAFLHHIAPFRVGNGFARQLFFENLAKNAGHTLDFSLATKDSITLASIKASEEGDISPLVILFEQMSDPEKVRALEEARSHRKIKQKEHTGPERKQSGEEDMAKDSKNVLIPSKRLPPLMESEISAMVTEDAGVHTNLEQIRILSKSVYGSSKTLNCKIVEIIQNPLYGHRLANQIEIAPESVAKLAGINFCGLKNSTRKNAEDYCDLLAYAVSNFSFAVQRARKEIATDYKKEQKRCAKTIAMPSENLQDALVSSRDLQQRVLKNSPTLQKELSDFLKNVSTRLSSHEHKAIKNGDYKTIASAMNTTENQAKKIINTVQKAKEMYHHSQAYTMSRSNVFAIAS